MSLRNRLVTDGNGPAVSLGVTAQAVLVEVGSVVVVELDGEVTELLQPNAAAAPAAPIKLSASRRPILCVCMTDSV